MPVRNSLDLQKKWLLHFPMEYGSSELTSARLATGHFYTFVFHGRTSDQLALLRFMRDKVCGITCGMVNLSSNKPGENTRVCRVSVKASPRPGLHGKLLMNLSDSC
jgi:hypothetical protein